MVYTAVGGLKATFITDFLHTAIALSIMIYLTLKVLTNEHVGGLGGLYDKLRANEDRVNVEGNYMGSLLTFKSYKAAIFGVVLKVCNLALVTMDTAFWQKSFASDVRYVLSTQLHINRLTHLQIHSSRLRSRLSSHYRRSMGHRHSNRPLSPSHREHPDLRHLS